MSDMSRPAPRPSAAVHEQHDALLLAQFAANDPLDEARQREAQGLIASCASCASLVVDLRAVSSAVAWEPVPPRRRDFRLDADEAERLSGSAFTRFLRRLSLPRARALQPAAAGMLSLGLVFVVAGYAWPDGGTVSVGDEPNVAPAVVEELAASTVMPLELRAKPEAPMAGAAEIEGSARSAAEPMAPESLADDLATQAFREGNARKSIDRDAFEVAEVESAVAAGDSNVMAGSDASEGLEMEMADALEPIDDQDEATLAAPAAVDGASAVEAEDKVTVSAPVDTSASVESALVVIGLALVLLGVALLFLVWLARRRTDPLLR